MQFDWLSQNWVLKVDLGTHLRDNHTHLFVRFGVILALVQCWSTQGWKLFFCGLSQNWNFKVDLDTHLRHKHGHLCLWDWELFLPSFKVGQTNVENMDFCRRSRNWVLKVDLGPNLRDKYGHLFLWYLEIFWRSFKVAETKVENMHFCWVNQGRFRYPFERY